MARDSQHPSRQLLDGVAARRPERRARTGRRIGHEPDEHPHGRVGSGSARRDRAGARGAAAANRTVVDDCRPARAVLAAPLRVRRCCRRPLVR